MKKTTKPPAGLAAQVARGMIAATLVFFLACLAAAQIYSSDRRKQELESRTLGQAVEKARRLETFLESCRQDLLLAAAQPLSKTALAEWLENLRRIRKVPYVELIWLPAISGVERMAASLRPASRKAWLLDTGQGVIEGLSAQALAGLKPGETRLLGPGRPLAPKNAAPASGGSPPKSVFRLALSSDNPSLGPGVLILAVDAREVRNRMGARPAQTGGFKRDLEKRFSWFADASGWILFQSAPPGRADRPLETYLARAGLEGTLGKTGLAAAFRPSDEHLVYWGLIKSIHSGEDGEAVPAAFDWPRFEGFSAFAPVRLFSRDGEASPVGLVVCADRDEGSAWSAAILVPSVCAGGCALVLATGLLLLYRLAVRPLRDLSAAMDLDIDEEEIDEIMPAKKCLETWNLQRALRGWKKRREQSAASLEERRAASMREPAPIEEPPWDKDIPEIRGFAPKLGNLKRGIQKAAATDADLLIIGETGTGKQLAAEAVHRLSRRSHMPLVSINCGALDDNLLLDALFGHVPGAFTQAKNHRQGAFAKAEGGTLFLDEIQNASPKTQQALLRVLTERRMRPLGSDEESAVDVRIIAGSNKDLAALLPGGEFREDLYYRLNALCLRTLPLREHKESIPPLAAYYLRQAEELAEVQGLRLSRGALEKMLAYAWPGNVRELINCVTRAAVMSSGQVIQAEEIKLDEETPAYLLVRPEETPPSPLEPRPRPNPGVGGPDEAAPLSPRQRMAMKTLKRRRAISRKDYQDIAGGHFSARAALRELNDLVRRGLVVRQGRGPATRYVLGGVN